MKPGNSISAFDDEFGFIQRNSNGSHVALGKPRTVANKIIEIPFLDNQQEKQRVLSVLLADIKWTINSDGKVSYISPFVDNCLGVDAKFVIKHLASEYLIPSSILSCLIELEKLKEIIRTFKNTEPRKLLVELVPNECNIEKIEITMSVIFDSKGNVVGISGLCNYLP